MNVSGNYQYSTNRQPNFKGSIKNTQLFTDCAMEYARNIKISDPDWAKLKMFINTIRAIKADKASDEFIIDTRKVQGGRLWFLKYGDYIKQDEYFKSEIYYGKSFGRALLEEDVFKRIVKFGKEYFGYKTVSKPIEEFSPANKYLKNAGRFISASKKKNNINVKAKLLENAEREERKAQTAISKIHSIILNNL